VATPSCTPFQKGFAQGLGLFPGKENHLVFDLTDNASKQKLVVQ